MLGPYSNIIKYDISNKQILWFLVTYQCTFSGRRSLTFVVS